MNKIDWSKMAKADPQSSRVQIKETNDGYEIVISPKKADLALVFTVFWLFFWVVGLVNVVSELPSSTANTAAFFNRLAWLGGWIIGGAAAITVLAWFLFGREIIRVNASKLNYTLNYGTFWYSREYHTTLVELLRVSPQTIDRWSIGFPVSANAGTVAFDYAAATRRFGVELDETEARQIVDTLLKRFPKLADA